MTMILAFMGLGPFEIFVILLVALLVFGRRLPEVARSLGQGMVEFRKGLRDEPDEPQPLPKQTDEETEGESLPIQTDEEIEAEAAEDPGYDADSPENEVSAEMDEEEKPAG